MKNTSFKPSRWVLLSALQKAIRRGYVDIALRAARQLQLTEPQILQRRLRVIAVEDIGVANLPLVREVLLAVDNPLPLVERMCASVKSRDACDLSETVNADACDGNSLCLEAARLIASRATDSINLLAEEVAALGYKLTKEPLCFAIPLVARMAESDSFTETVTLPTSPLLHDWPAYAFCQYTREGKAAFRLLLKTHHRLREELAKWSTDPLGLLGNAVFVVESGLLDKRLVFPGSADILRLAHHADVKRFGVPREQADHIIKLASDHLPAINEARREVLHCWVSPYQMAVLTQEYSQKPN